MFCRYVPRVVPTTASGSSGVPNRSEGQPLISVAAAAPNAFNPAGDPSQQSQPQPGLPAGVPPGAAPAGYQVLPAGMMPHAHAAAARLPGMVR